MPKEQSAGESTATQLRSVLTRCMYDSYKCILVSPRYCLLEKNIMLYVARIICNVNLSKPVKMT